jgi:hypothetical protein
MLILKLPMRIIHKLEIKNLIRAKKAENYNKTKQGESQQKAKISKNYNEQ